MVDMMAIHGFTCCLSGRLMRSLETDCRRMGWSWVEAPLGGIVLGGWVFVLEAVAKR